MVWLADDIDTSVRRRCRIPDGASVVSASELREIMDEEIFTTFVPFLKSVREEWWVQTYEASIVSGQENYRIPSRAAAGAVRDVTIVNSDGEGPSLDRVDLEVVDQYRGGSSWHWPNGAAFAIQDDEIIILPTPNQTSGTLRIRYERRPSKMMAAADAMDFTVTGISGGLITTITEVAATHSITTGDTVDVVQARPHFRAVLLDATATEGMGGEWTISPGITQDGSESGAQDGDYVCPAGYSPVPQIPAELHPMLVTACCARVYELLRRVDLRDSMLAKLERELAGARAMLTPRVTGERETIVNRWGGTRSGSWR